METKLERPQVVSANAVVAGRRLRSIEQAPIAIRQRTLQRLENDLADESVRLLNLPHRPANRISRSAANAERREVTLYLRVSRQVGWMALDLVSDYVPNSRALFSDAWYDQANCLDMDELFFPEELRLRERDILASGIWDICQSCSVRSSCLETGVYFEEEDGVWGGYDYAALFKIRDLRRRIVKKLLADYAGAPIEALNFSRRTEEVLVKNGIRTVGRLLDAKDMKLRQLRGSGFSDKSVFMECKREVAALLLEDYSFRDPAPAENEAPSRPDTGGPRHLIKFRQSPFNDQPHYVHTN